MSSAAVPVVPRTGDVPASKHLEGCVRREVVAPDPLAEVVANCRKGDAQAQRELVLQTQERVFRVVVRLVGWQDAEDVSQQVYLQVFRQIGRFHGESSFGTWLYRVTVNEALQHLRRRRRRRWISLSWEPEEDQPDRQESPEARELLDHALARIEPDLRAVFILRELEGLCYESIGAALGIPPGTVASRLNRARTDLQQQLRRLGWTG